MLFIALTVRCGSQRFPNKVVSDIDGSPLIWWLVKRFQGVENAKLIVATTDQPEDDKVVDAVNGEAEVWRHAGDPNDVFGRIEAARKALAPQADFVFRALGDCPFYATELLDRAIKMLRKFKAEAFCWSLPPENLPVYGAREFPYSLKAWSRMVRNAKQREHTDHYFTTHREQFFILYHEPPPSIYIRPSLYRLEVDHLEDVDFLQALIAGGLTMLSPLSDVIKFLDSNPKVCEINNFRMEKTGPLTTYGHKERRKWFNNMRGKRIVDWQNNIWHPPTEKSVPIFCDAGKCMVGYGSNGRLYTTEGHQLGGPDRINCSCGTGTIWHAPIRQRAF